MRTENIYARLLDFEEGRKDRDIDKLAAYFEEGRKDREHGADSIHFWK
jgi:hypothetical protein